MRASSRSKLARTVALVCMLALLAGCGPSGGDSPTATARVEDFPPTPALEALQVTGEQIAGERLRVTFPSLTLLKRDEDMDAQWFFVLTDDRGAYTYLLYPANRSGETGDAIQLTDYPLDLGITGDTSTVTLWLLAVHNRRYQAAEEFGLDALASSLAIGFRNWLRSGDPQDDPLAAIVSASDGALFEWFAGITVLGEGMITFTAEEGWPAGVRSLHTPDGGISAVYLVQDTVLEQAAPVTPAPSPVFPHSDRPGYTPVLDETFAGGTSTATWYQGQDETFVNAIVSGAYEIRLRDIEDRDFARSWGSLENQRFSSYVVEAQVRLLDGDARAASYGIWFNYQDDFNFVYFGISSEGEYRVAVIARTSQPREIQPWTPHPAILPGAATNILTVEAAADGGFSLFANGVSLGTFRDETFTSGSVAFFCYAESVPTTCRLEHLRIWQAQTGGVSE